MTYLSRSHHLFSFLMAFVFTHVGRSGPHNFNFGHFLPNVKTTFYFYGKSQLHNNKQEKIVNLHKESIRDT